MRAQLRLDGRTGATVESTPVMQLTSAETEFFYATWTPLLAFVNERKRIVPKLDPVAAPEGAAQVRDALWEEPSLLDEFVRDNPAKLSAEALALAASWRHRHAGSFVLYRQLQRHMVVIEDGRAATLYGVHALRTPLDRMVPWLPCMVKGVLLPFGDRIVFDGLLTMYRIHYGPGIRSSLAETYRTAKGQIVTRLGPPQALAAALAPAAAPRPKKAAKAAKATEKKPPEEGKALTNPGRCEGCGEVFSKRAIGRHVASCEALHAPGKGKVGPRYRLLVESPGMPEYWLQVEVGAATTLRELDRFLRNIWLECCGHLSAFKIGGESFASTPDDSGWGFEKERTMAAKVSGLVDVPTWKYEYDFGTTTELRVRPAATSVGTAKGVRLLARNLPPLLPCLKCGAPAAEICSQCRWENGGCLCAQCAKKHPCGEDYLLPAVNSPRAGECGYTG